MSENGNIWRPLEGRVALVTGGAQGIGAGICEELAGAGAAVAIVDWQLDKTSDLAERLVLAGQRVIAIHADITTEEGRRYAVTQTVGTLGGLDILINNAAPGRKHEMLGQIASADWAIHDQVVLQAAVHLTDACLPYLANTGRGTVVNISSAVATSVALDQCSWPYHVSKAGLNHLTRWLAARLGQQSIRVNAVAPGLVNRENGPQLTDNPTHLAVIKNIVPLGRAGRAADVAKAVVFLCSDQSAYMTGQVLVVDGGLGLAEVFGASLRAYQASHL